MCQNIFFIFSILISSQHLKQIVDKKNYKSNISFPFDILFNNFLNRNHNKKKLKNRQFLKTNFTFFNMNTYENKMLYKQKKKREKKTLKQNK